MKALDILIDLADWCEHTSQHRLINEKIDEAIAELEALQNRSCENCKRFQLWSETKDISNWDSCWIGLGLCSNGVQTGCFNSTVDKDFCCNKWESK